MRIGSSVASKDPLGLADACGADLVQVHLSAPQQWRNPVARADAQTLRESGRIGSVHAPYLCNPASATEAVRDKSWASLQAQLDASATVGAAGLVVHAGQAGPKGSIDQAVERWLVGIGELKGEVPLLIENTATGQAAPGRHLATWIALVRAIRAEARHVTIGVCLDTCHAFAGDPEAAADPTGWVTEVREQLGGIDLLHVNDSKVAGGAGQDRHEALGDGMMGDALAAMVIAAQAPAAVLETPGDDDRRRLDLAWLADVA